LKHFLVPLPLPGFFTRCALFVLRFFFFLGNGYVLMPPFAPGIFPSPLPQVYFLFFFHTVFFRFHFPLQKNPPLLTPLLYPLPHPPSLPGLLNLRYFSRFFLSLIPRTVDRHFGERSALADGFLPVTKRTSFPFFLPPFSFPAASFL